jgi:V-type H+-transporting ATPase subunit d
MIDNIILLITGTLHHRAIGDLLPRCHPLGSFEQLGAITVADTPAQLYTAVLVDTPLGIEFNYLINNMFIFFSAPYFIDCISEHDLDELNVEIIRSTLYKVSKRN